MTALPHPTSPARRRAIGLETFLGLAIASWVRLILMYSMLSKATIVSCSLTQIESIQYSPHRTLTSPPPSSPAPPFLSMQVSQENAYRAIAKLRPEPCILLQDRAALDGATFCSVPEWEHVLALAETTTAILLSRYDVVLHLASTASSPTFEALYEYGENSNNSARFHTCAEAKEADAKTTEVRLCVLTTTLGHVGLVDPPRRPSV